MLKSKFKQMNIVIIAVVFFCKYGLKKDEIRENGFNYSFFSTVEKLIG
jgi:hypothetical protein